MGEKEKVCNFVRSKEYYFTNYNYHLIKFKTYEIVKFYYQLHHYVQKN